MVACLYLSIYNGFCLILSLSRYIYSCLRFDLFFIYQSVAFYIVVLFRIYDKTDPDDASTELISIGFEHYRKFWQLREHFRKEGTQLFQLTAKAHHNCHACLLSAALNPRHRVSTQSSFCLLRFGFVLKAFSLFVSLALCIHVYMYFPCCPPT